MQHLTDKKTTHATYVAYEQQATFQAFSVSRQDAKNAKLHVIEFMKISWRPWRLGGS